MSKRISQVQKPTRTKKKREDVEEPSRFVAQLASLASNDLDNGAQCCSRQGIEEKWKRPLLCLKANKASVDIVLQAIDIDYYTDSSYDMVIRLFGVTQSENSVCLQLHGFLPYFLVRIENSFEKKHIARFMSHLNSLVKAQLSGTGVSKEVEKVVMKMEILHGTSIYGYSKDINQKFLKVYLRSYKLISVCRRIFDEGVDLFGNGEHLSFASYEANIDFTIRFMVDLSLVGCGWITVAAGTYEVVPEQLMMSRCQLECTVLYSDLLVHPSDSSPEWSSIAPLRILSFDIECMNRKGIFPEAHTDAIIQIANMVKREGENEPFIRNCFVIGDTDQVIGSDIIVCQNEQEMLERWASFVRTVDPDFITGFNIQNFDIPYIVERAKTLKIENRVTMLGRVRNVLSKVRESQVASKQMGSRMNKVTNMEGRVIFDVYQIVLRDYKLRSYTLNSISYHFLGEQKEDVMYSIIAELQHGDAVSRKRLAVYCMKDAYLPLRLLEKLMSVINYVEMARVTGVPLVFLISRGQQIKVLSQLLRKAKSLNYFLPVIETAVAEETFEGALVIEPKRGFYNEPIVTLDFASLYPSIMIAHNLCYTTLIQSTSDSERLSEEDYIITPSNNRFAKPSLRRGLLPEVLEDLLQARKRVKNELKVETDPFRKMVLNGRQLALKISANSVYGFTGATVGKLPCLEISQSVTAFGRQMIELTKRSVEEIFIAGSLEGMCPRNAQVIYGDTDSVMIKFGVKDISTAIEIGRRAAVEMSKIFIPPIRLEFEKIYFPYLLISKKRYAGMYFTRAEKPDYLDCKGIETVRRDNCPLVGKALNACLKKMLVDGDAESAVEYAKKIISDLLCNRVDISELIITKELTRASEAYTAKQAHVILADRMRERDPGSAPRLGDRVPYVIVAKGQKVPNYEKAEDPIYVLQNNIPIDFKYYLENQLAKPLARIFEPILGDKAESILTGGKHTLVKHVSQPKVGALSSFFMKSERCMSCKSGLPKGWKGATCEHCKPNEGKVFMKHMALMNITENHFARLWTECQNCAGTVNDEVLCSARDCPIFYMREKVKLDLTRQMEEYRRFVYSTW